jgi:hypothetical protein
MTAFGFNVAAPLVDDLEHLDVDAPLRAFQGRSLITYFDAKGGTPPRDAVAWSARLGARPRSDLPDSHEFPGRHASAGHGG